MSDSYTAEIRTSSDASELSASGQWSEDFRTRPRGLTGLRRMGQIAGVLWAVATSPATAIHDPWFLDRRSRDQATIILILQSVIGRPISRAEALCIVRQILEKAERERLEIADFEAARGIQWEDKA